MGVIKGEREVLELRGVVSKRKGSGWEKIVGMEGQGLEITSVTVENGS